MTCATWQDIWINEGFATLAGYLATEYLAGLGREGKSAPPDMIVLDLNLPRKSGLVVLDEIAVNEQEVRGRR